MNALPTYRIFISSPSDVADERDRALQVIDRLNGDFKDEVNLRVVNWKDADYSLGDPFQTQIESPINSDLVVGIVWARAGHPLDLAHYRRPDGTAYESGTIYEIETALNHFRRHRSPDVVLYRRDTDPPARRGEAGYEQVRQREILDSAIERWTRTDSGEFKGAYNEFSKPSEFEERWQRRLRKWLGTLGFGTPTWHIDKDGSPFPGLTPYDERYQRVFFGRENAIRLCDEQLREAAMRGCAFLLIVGASGSGKSSLARAGLMPRIAGPTGAPRVNKWRTAWMLPGTAPLQSLANSLFDALPALAAHAHDAPTWAREVTAHPPFAASSLAQALAPDERLLLLVDQLEEVFVQAFDGFAGALDAIARSRKASVIATLRADRYADPLTDSTLMALKADGASYDLAAPSGDDFENIIRRPALAAGLTFEWPEGSDKDLGKVLRDAVTKTDALPLLQVTLAQLFDARDPATRALTFTAYDAIGKLEGAIGRHADHVLAQLGSAEQIELRSLLLELTSAGPGGEYHARPVKRVAFETTRARQSLVKALLEARLLVHWEGTLRVAHEALLRHWGAARSVLDAHAVFLRVRDRLEPQARDWRAEGELKTQVLQPGRLLSDAASVLPLLRDTSDAGLLVAFVEASLEEEERGRKIIESRLAGDEQKVLNFLIGRDYEGAYHKLDEIIDYLKEQVDGDVVARRKALLKKRQRVHRLADFYRARKRAFSLAGEEDFEGSRRECDLALRALGWRCDSQWWRHLPIADVNASNIEHLKHEAYRTLLLLSGLQLVPGIISLFPPREASAPRPKPVVDFTKLVGKIPRFVLSTIIGAGGVGPFRLPGPQGNADALAAFQTSISLLTQVREIEEARATERAERPLPSRTTHLVRQIAEVLSKFAEEPTDVPIDYRQWLNVPVPETRPEPVNAADYFFIGLFNFFVAKRAEGVVPKIISLLQGTFPDLDGETPLYTAERLLRTAVALEPQFYWPHWVLGRTLQTKGDYGGAELAFNAAVALDPDYARGYEQRALTLGRQWTATKEEMLQQRALSDSQMAEKVANGDPSIFWPRGELLQLLGRTRDAVEAYSLWLELEQDILSMIARSNGVAQLYLFAKKLLKTIISRDAESCALATDARALLALVYMTWGRKNAEDREIALNEAEAVIKLDPHHAHALTAKGVALCHNGDWREAASILESALERDSGNYRAALNRAMAYEKIGPPEVALAAWRELPDMSRRATRHRCPAWMLEAAEAAQTRILSGS